MNSKAVKELDKKYIAEYENMVGVGYTLEAAYSDLRDNHGDMPGVDDCTFYEARVLKVETKIIEVQQPVQVG